MNKYARQIKPRRKTRLKQPIRGRVYDVLRDVPDIRDRVYEPTLSPLPVHLPSPQSLEILDQGREGSCTGFALSAVVNLLLRHRRERARKLVSPYMLYAMARNHDEWPGDKYDGSSLRGALRGFYNNGVCEQKYWPSLEVKELDIDAAKNARNITLGAYYRLRPILSDYHAAITETGVIYASAAVHAGWENPLKGTIEAREGAQLHAFAIVGYDDEAFLVQNSWGRKWGRGGLARWLYKDWAANIQDAWVLQLGIPAPSAFGLGVKRDHTTKASDLSGGKRAAPPRQDIAGHFVHVENGDFSSTQPYFSTRKDVEDTAALLAGSPPGKYNSLLFYAHGGLNTPEAAAIRTSAMTNVFMANGIYPYSVFYDTGLMATLRDIIAGHGAAITQKSGGLLDLTDDLIEKAVGGIGKKLWNEMKADASSPFEAGRDGETALRLFVTHLKAKALPIHLVGHSAGSILVGRLLAALDRLVPEGMTIDSCSLMAPACSIDFYRQLYRPRLGAKATAPVKLRRMTLYCLDDRAEQDDQVTPMYNKSLLYLVSNAFEPKRGMPLLGMEVFLNKEKIAKDPLTTWITNKPGAPTKSTTHGGFDNDPDTLNDILRSVLGKKPQRPFSKQDLDY